MTGERWQSVKDILHQALQLPAEQRRPFLDQVCSCDVSLRTEVQSLLAADDHIRTSFLQSPAAEGLVPTVDCSLTLEPGQMFAERFFLVRPLGAGGMGQVWLADQTAPVRRPVALKLIRAGMYDQSVVQRFLSERQSLAMMDHPSIAKVFDAGTTERGQPYFVMEYVPGLPITDYCDQKRLNIKERLALFIQVCEGVQHAHQKAIIHRDLKPANILMPEVGGKAMPRIIDFGLAKPTARHLRGEDPPTQLGSFIGTPGYISPEQANSAGYDVDTRTDVYSMGSVLYMLLTGDLPLDVNQRSQPLAEVLRKLREEEPSRPSAKVGKNRATARATAAARATEPAHLISQLRGDLDWITMKALEKDRTRRYGTPAELAADIQRYLEHEPVVARPESSLYRLRKYIRRHRAGVTVATTLALLLASFATVQTVQLRRITRERDRANRITDFMTGMFTVADPTEARGNTVTAREILDKAAKDLDQGLAHDPQVQSQMMQVMATTYDNLGLYPRAHDLAERGLEARKKIAGPQAPVTLQSMTQVGGILEEEGRLAESYKLESEALAIEQRVLGINSSLTVDTEDRLAQVLEDQGRFDEAEKLERSVIDWRTRNLGASDIRTLKSINHMGVLLTDSGRYAEADSQFRQLLDTDLRVLGTDHPQTMRAMANLASAYQNEERYADAEPLYRRLLIVDRRVLGPDHRDTAIDMENLASLLDAEHRLPEAEQLYRAAGAILSRTMGAEHQDVFEVNTNLSRVLLDEGRIREADRLLRQTIASETRVLGQQSVDTLWSVGYMVRILNREARYAEAETLARKTLEMDQRVLGSQHPHTLGMLGGLCLALAHTHRYDAASKLLRDAITAGSSAQQGNKWYPWYLFACIAMAVNHREDAIQYLQEAVHRGYNDADGLLATYEFRDLRGDPGFQKVLAQMRPATVPVR